MSDRKTLARALADGLLAGEWSPRGLLESFAAVTGRRPRRLSKLVVRLLFIFPEPPHAERDALIQLLEGSGELSPRGSPRVYSIAPPQMGQRRWPVPELAAVADLARFLDLPLRALEGIADLRSIPVQSERAANYRARWIPKRSGGARLLEVPRPRLREVQRRILHGIPDAIPPHPAAHGFRPGGSLGGFVAPHLGRALVLKLDLESFFTSIAAARVRGVFRAAGYPSEVARTLAALCTHRTPEGVRSAAPDSVARTLDERWRILKRLAAPHLPQGAPTSPALANLCARGLDARLSAAAGSVGARYTRYADDLAFSFDAAGARRAHRFASLAAGIALDEGFQVQFRKTRFMRAGTRQRLAGLVVNERRNVPRDDYDRLRAMLHRAACAGVEAVTGLRGEHARDELLGRIAWAAQENPARAAKLHGLFARIRWD